jgi:hypothetical protein
MESLRQQLIAQANKKYQEAIAKIPEHLRYADTANKIARLWKQGGVGRKSIGDISKDILPICLHLQLGPTDRFDVEANLFIEDVEERFGLDFDASEIQDEETIVFYYDRSIFSRRLVIFFMLHERGNCRIVQEETEPTVIKNYKRRVICG